MAKFVLFLTAVAVLFGCQAQKLPVDTAHATQLVDANIIATHAYQVLLVIKPPPPDNPDQAPRTIDAAAWSAGDAKADDLQSVVDTQKLVMAAAAEEAAAWEAGKAPRFDPGRDAWMILNRSGLRPTSDKLPVNVLAAYFKEKSPQTTDLQARALASLLQMMLDVERDATTVQDLFRVYHAAGLPVYLGQLGIPDATDEDLARFGQEVAPRMAASPFDVDAKTLKMMGRKMYNWGRRYTGERDKAVLARELLGEADIQVALPLIRKMPAQKIAVIGHSFTMGVHWASPSAFVPITAEMLKMVNPGVEVRQWEAGGLTASRALNKEKFYEQALAWKPDRVLLALGGRSPADREAMKTMIDGFVAAGVEVMEFDQLWPARPRPTTAPAGNPPPAATAPAPSPKGYHRIEVGKLLVASPDNSKFVALDGIHMTEPWHRLMAKEWIKYLAGARQDKLPQ